MENDSLTTEEAQEAEFTSSTFRNKYMCSIGPVADDLISKSLSSKESCLNFSNIITNFFNSTYFQSKGDSKLPLASKDILGLDVWQGPCRIYNMRPISNNKVLLGIFEGNVYFNHVNLFRVLEYLDSAFFEVIKKETNGTCLKYNYITEIAFSNVEQVFLFCRALWYYLETAVCHHALSLIDKRSNATRLVGKVLTLRETLMSPFLHINFPETHFYSKVSQMTNEELGTHYNKYLLSKFRVIQRQVFLISKMLLNEGENKIDA